MPNVLQIEKLLDMVEYALKDNAGLKIIGKERFSNII